MRHPEHVAGLVLLGAEPGMWTDLGSSRQEHFLTDEETRKKDQILEQLRALREENGMSRREILQLVVYNFQLNGDWKRQQFYRPTPERAAQTRQGGRN